jgi:hypothetical protein
MYHTFQNFYNWRLQPLILISIAICIKIAYFVFVFLSSNSHLPYFNIVINGDDVTYMSFTENIFLTGNYCVKTGAVYDYTFRMPGFAFLYVPIRFFTNKIITMNCIVIIQVVLSGIAAYCLARLAKNIFKNNHIFYFVYLLTTLGFYLPMYNNILVTESLATSFLIFSFYFLFQAFDTKKSSLFLVSGFFMTWLIFLRAFMIVIFIVTILLIIWYVFNKVTKIKNLIFFMLPFLLIDGAWATRNYYKLQRFYPLESSVNANECNLKCIAASAHFIQAFGFQWEQWARDSERGWLESNNLKAMKKNSIFPPRTFNGGLTIDSLLKARECIQLANNFNLGIDERTFADKNATRLLNKFITELKKNRPWDYYLFNKLRSVRSFLSENLYYPLISLPFPMNGILVFIDLFIDKFLKFVGLFGAFFILFKFYRDYITVFIITSVPFFLLALFPVFLGDDEHREFFMAYPFLIISSAYFFTVLFKSRYKWLLSALVLVIPFWLAAYSTFLKIYY